MSIAAFKNALIPQIKAFCNVPIIEAEQKGPKPTGPHATFKITTPYLKGVGQAEETGQGNETSYTLNRVEEFKRILSITAYDEDADASFELAQKIHDWFSFYGSDFLDANNMVVADQTAVANRDIFLIEDYERRNGFDITMRLTREINQDIEYIESLKEFTRIERDYSTEVEAESSESSTEDRMTMAGETSAGENNI